jgi:hypothetical protein
VDAPDSRGRGKVLIGALIIAALMYGWYVMSREVMGNTRGDAFGECLGVGLGLTVLVSTIGAVRASRRHPDSD